MKRDMQRKMRERELAETKMTRQAGMAGIESSTSTSSSSHNCIRQGFQLSISNTLGTAHLRLQFHCAENFFFSQRFSVLPSRFLPFHAPRCAWLVSHQVRFSDLPSSWNGAVQVSMENGKRKLSSLPQEPQIQIMFHTR